MVISLTSFSLKPHNCAINHRCEGTRSLINFFGGARLQREDLYLQKRGLLAQAILRKVANIEKLFWEDYNNDHAAKVFTK